MGREGFFNLLKAAYATAFPAPHPCHTGPLYGKVVREFHRDSGERRLRRAHMHAAVAFVAEHRWKAVERTLRENHGVKVVQNTVLGHPGTPCQPPETTPPPRSPPFSSPPSPTP